MAVEHFTARGHSEVGHVESGPTDVPWGRTQEEGVAIQIGVQSVDLFSSQSVMDEDAGITRASLSLVIRLISSSLTAIRRALAIPASALTGNLTAATPTAEVLAIRAGDIGSEQLALYSEGAGPSGAGTRRIDVPRAMLTDIGELVQAKVSWMLPQVTFRILDPTVNFATPLPVVTFTDSV